MTWETEMRPIVRWIVDDIDSSSYEYTNDQIDEIIVISAFMIQNEVNFEQAYTVSISGKTISPDPASSPIDEPFLSLVSLKAGCMILSGKIQQYAREGIKVTDGPSTIDATRRVDQIQDLYKIACDKYEKAKTDYMINGDGCVRSAIVGPSVSEASILKWGNL